MLWTSRLLSLFITSALAAQTAPVTAKPAGVDNAPHGQDAAQTHAALSLVVVGNRSVKLGATCRFDEPFDTMQGGGRPTVPTKPNTDSRFFMASSDAFENNQTALMVSLDSPFGLLSARLEYDRTLTVRENRVVIVFSYDEDLGIDSMEPIDDEKARDGIRRGHTHYVKEIHWGAAVLFRAEVETSSSEERRKLLGSARGWFVGGARMTDEHQRILSQKRMVFSTEIIGGPATTDKNYPAFAKAKAALATVALGTFPDKSSDFHTWLDKELRLKMAAVAEHLAKGPRMRSVKLLPLGAHRQISPYASTYAKLWRARAVALQRLNEHLSNHPDAVLQKSFNTAVVAHNELKSALETKHDPNVFAEALTKLDAVMPLPSDQRIAESKLDIAATDGFVAPFADVNSPLRDDDYLSVSILGDAPIAFESWSLGPMEKIGRATQGGDISWELGLAALPRQDSQQLSWTEIGLGGGSASAVKWADFLDVCFTENLKAAGPGIVRPDTVGRLGFQIEYGDIGSAKTCAALKVRLGTAKPHDTFKKSDERQHMENPESIDGKHKDRTLGHNGIVFSAYPKSHVSHHDGSTHATYQGCAPGKNPDHRTGQLYDCIMTIYRTLLEPERIVGHTYLKTGETMHRWHTSLISVVRPTWVVP